MTRKLHHSPRLRWFLHRGVPTVLLTVLAACGSDDDDDGGIPQPTAEDYQDLEAWKQRPIKACSFDEAMPRLAAVLDEGLPPGPTDTAPPTRLVDGRALLTRTGGHALFSAGAATIGLGEPGIPNGSSNQIRTKSRTVDGKRQSIKLEAAFDGGECVLRIDDQETYRIRLFSSFPIALHADADALAHAYDGAAEVPFTYRVSAGDLPSALAGLEPIVAPVRAALAPKPRAHEQLAAFLGADLEEIRTRFPLLGASPAVASARLKDRPEATRFAVGFDASIVAGLHTSLEPIFGATGDTTLAMEWYLTPPAIGLAEYTDAAAGLWTLDLSLALRGLRTDATDTLLRLVKPSVISLTVAAAHRLDNFEASRCFAGRLYHLGQFAVGMFRPAYATVATPCEVLAVSFEEALVSDRSARAVLALKAQRSGFSRQHDYLGWDDALIRVARALVRRGQDPTILPGGPELATAVDRHRSIIAGVSTASVRDDFGEDVIEMTLRWMFEVTPVAPSALTAISATLENVGGIAPTAVRAMLSELVLDAGDGSSGMAAARCGRDLVGERRTRIATILERAALHAGLRSWRSMAVDSLLEVCWSDARVGELTTSLDHALTFAAADTARHDDADPMFDDDLSALLAEIMEEGWTEDTFATMYMVLAYARMAEPGCADHHAVSSQLACLRSIGAEHIDRAGMLSPAYGARYRLLAEKLIDETRAWMDRVFSINFPVQTAFFKGERPLWGSCSNDAFADRSRRLFELLHLYRPSKDLDEQLAIEHLVRDLLAECP